MANRLAESSSPYLLQHADNPVDWHEWGAEAFDLAATTDRPVLLSVGYSACHWCHVMAHESFEDDATAAYMNEHFVNVKVDREERPDVDRVYMEAVQAMTGRGGWPMTVFLTPAGDPFFAGTYFPKEDRAGYPSFRRLMEAITDAWRNRRDELTSQAARIVASLSREPAPTEGLPDEETVAKAYAALLASFDAEHAGFGGAPKFPQAPTLELLLRLAGRPAYPEAAAMLSATLGAMADGGIYDHLGGGFARYSVDQRWLVPHFEKMLYDNALLARVYVRGWQVTGRDLFRAVAVETLDYMLSDLLLPGGGFASAEDADSEGEEGKFYVFAHDEFHAVVGEADGALAADYFGVTAGGNFEGATILHRARTADAVADDHGVAAADVEAAVGRARSALLRHRSGRVRPGLDDKVVAAWNGLAVRALAEAGAVLGEPRYVQAAERTARFLLAELRTGDGRLLRSWRERPGTVPGFSEDYGAVAVALLTLYQVTGAPGWYRDAQRLVDDLLELFADADGSLYATAADAEELIVRPRDVMDNPAPSGASLAAEALLMLAAYTGEARYVTALDAVLRQAGQLLDKYPLAVGHLLAVAATRLFGVAEVAIVGDAADPARGALERVVWEEFRPDCVLAVGDGDGAGVVPLLHGRAGSDGPLAFVCEGFVCDLPTGDPDDLRTQLSAVRGGTPQPS